MVITRSSRRLQTSAKKGALSLFCSGKNSLGRFLDPNRHSSASVGPLLNATVAYQETGSIFCTITLILSEYFYHYFVRISENHLYPTCHQKT